MSLVAVSPAVVASLGELKRCVYGPRRGRRRAPGEAFVDYAIITVHGTWPAARWYELGSPFLTLLQASLEEKSITSTVHSFRWSGKNSLLERAKARAALVDFVAEVQSSRPDGRVVLISHSHGGNISLGAAQDPSITVAAICTMATPFQQVFPDKSLSQFDQANIFYLFIISLLDLTWIADDSRWISLALVGAMLAAWLSLRLLPFLKDEGLQERVTQELLRISEQEVTNPGRVANCGVGRRMGRGGPSFTLC